MPCVFNAFGLDAYREDAVALAQDDESLLIEIQGYTAKILIMSNQLWRLPA